jgi:hypothetical protein
MLFRNDNFVFWTSQKNSRRTFVLENQPPLILPRWSQYTRHKVNLVLLSLGKDSSCSSTQKGVHWNGLHVRGEYGRTTQPLPLPHPVSLQLPSICFSKTYFRILPPLWSNSARSTGNWYGYLQILYVTTRGNWTLTTPRTFVRKTIGNRKC